MYSADTFILEPSSSVSLSTDDCHIDEQETGSREDRALLMHLDVADSVARAIADYCSKFHQPRALIVFQGDDPLFADPAWFRDALKVFRSQMPKTCATTFTIQTRATTLDDAWLDLCAELGVAITVTLGAPFQGSNRNQANATGVCTRADAFAVLERIQYHPRGAELCRGVLCVVDPDDDGRFVYHRLRSLGIVLMDFMLPEANWDHPPAERESPTAFADYLIPIFDEWWSENNPNVRIACFDTLLRMIVGSHIRSDSFGADPLTKLVVDRDGNIELIDALRGSSGLPQVQLNVRRDSIERIFQQPALQRALAGQETLSRTCRMCELRDVCGGGYLPSRFRRSNSFDNPNVFCPDLTKLIRHVVDSCARELASTV